MTKKELLSKLLIQPKELVLKEGFFQGASQAVFTNLETDFTYLADLAGFAKPQTLEADCFVIAVGDAPELPCDLIFCNDEAYYLDIAEQGLVIAASTEAGALLGLKAYIRMASELEEMPQMTIFDYPDIPFRAVHTCIFRPDDGTEKEESHPEYIKKMMKMAALSGYNHIFIEFWGMFPYSMDYAHWPNAYTKAEITDLVSYAIDCLHITPLPAQNLTSHAGWSRIVTRQHTVLDQRPDLAEMYIPGGWCFATENPKTKEFIKQLIDELAEMFRNPPYLHCCCDKCFGFGSTEEDRTMSADILFAKHISFLNTYLAEKNIRMVMWGDMLYSSTDSLYWKCNEKIADLLPKNILINIWTHNNPGKRWQDATFFEERGFETVYSPFINEESIESMVWLCADRGSHGMVQTTWHRPQTAVPYVVLTGALQWSGKKPQKEIREQFAKNWYV